MLAGSLALLQALTRVSVYTGLGRIHALRTKGGQALITADGRAIVDGRESLPSYPGLPETLSPDLLLRALAAVRNAARLFQSYRSTPWPRTWPPTPARRTAPSGL